MRGLTNKVFIVTGAGSGIGAATALRLVDEGAKVAAADISVPGLEKTVAAAGSRGDAIVAIPFDLGDEASIVNMVDQAVKAFGRIDGVTNVAADISPATMGKDVDVANMAPALWTHVLQVNLIGTATVIRETLPHLEAAGGGSIVNISSVAAWMGDLTLPAYAASKSGLNALTRHTARAGGSKNIRCNAIAPGVVLTDALKAVTPKETIDRLLAQVLLSRLGQPDDIAASVAFMLSDESSWMTGQIMSVNGGQLLRE